MKIVISTGIYPPEVGGTAEYAKALRDIWASQGHAVSLKIFGKFRKLPWGVRHIVYFFYILPAVSVADYVVALDGFSAGVVAIAAKIFSKKVVFRTGGDLLWEAFVERTKQPILLKDFYKTSLDKLSAKEKLMFSLMQWTLRNLSAIIWSTEWQKEIFIKPYDLSVQKHFIVENYYGQKGGDIEPDPRLRSFVASGRDIYLKNITTLKHVFNKNESKIPENVDLLTSAFDYPTFIEKIKDCYAVVVVSLSEISPNTILDAIRYNRPFICTKEVGIFNRIKDAGIFVNSLHEAEIETAVLTLLDNNEYEKARQKVRDFSFTHTWEQIAQEFLDIYKKI